MDLVSETFVTDAEAKELLEMKRKEAELKFEQKNAVEVLGKFVTLDAKKSRDLVNELRKVPALRERQIIAIVNFLPKDTDDLRAILNKEYSSLKKEDITLILETVKKL